MKAKRFLAAFCLGLSVLLCISFIVVISHQSVQATMPAANQGLSQGLVGNIAGGQPVFGSTELSLTAGTGNAGNSGALNLASSATTAGTASVACYNMTIIPTMAYTGSATASLYMGSGTTCTCLLMSGGSPQYGSKTGGLILTLTAGTGAIVYTQDGTIQKSLSLPQVTNTNQLWFKLTDSGSGSGSIANAATCNVEAIYTK